MPAYITINADGSCITNPGTGGFAAIIQQGEEEFTVTGGAPNTTNNRMELSAVIEALRAVNADPRTRDAKVTLRSDATYVVNAFTEG